jgi:hypothetical protein
MSVDKMAENSKQNDKSPFQYGWNNPVKNLDPDGNFPIDAIWDAANVVFDIAKITYGGLTGNNAMVANGTKDLAADALALAIPYVPAGASKVLRAASTADDVTAAADGAKGKTNTKDNPKEIIIDGKKYPESAKHLQEAIDAGKKNEGTVDRKGSSARRKENMKGEKTEKGKDRDEAPPAVINTGQKSSVKKIPSSDNRGAGQSIGQQLRGVPDGTKVVILPKFK